VLTQFRVKGSENGDKEMKTKKQPPKCKFKKVGHPFRIWFNVGKDQAAAQFQDIFAKNQPFNSLKNAQANYNEEKDGSIIAIKLVNIRYPDKGSPEWSGR
jgi:hypothetical protein